MHFAPLVLIVACELLLLSIELFHPLPAWLHMAASVSLAATALAFIPYIKRHQAHLLHGLRCEIDGMQQKAAKAARRYKSLLEGAGNAIFIFNADSGVLEEENRLGRELLGYSKQELASMLARDLLPATEHEKYRSFMIQLKRQGRADLDGVLFRRKDGSLFLAELNARLINLGDEQVLHCLLRDVTEKRRTEKEAWQRNRELSILNNMLTGIEQTTELRAVQERTLLELIDLFQAAGGTLHLCDAQEAAPSLWASSQLSPHQEQGIQESVAVGRERFREVSVIPANPAEEGGGTFTAIPINAHDHLIGVMHLIHEEPRGYTPEELRFLEGVGKQMGSLIEKGRLFAELKWKNEELIRSHRLLEKSSHSLSVSELNLKRNLALVEQANQEQDRLDRMKNQFLGMVSHEFNTPLTSIISGVDHLLQSGACSESNLMVLEMVRDGGLRLKGLVGDLLKLVRLEARRGTLDTSAVHLESFLVTLVEQLRPQLDQRGQEVALVGLEALPYFDADHGYLQRVFGELLRNAIRFGPESGKIVVKGRVVDREALHERREILERFHPGFAGRCGERCYIEVEVRDNGSGIPLEEQRRIFDIFYEVGEIRHHSSAGSSEQGGAGLGLAMVKGMVEAHGGMVWVESASGSSFFLMLPLEQQAIQPALF